MKQKISVEQLKQLTPEQREKLQEWWEPKLGDWYYYPKVGNSWPVTSSCSLDLERIKETRYPLLSIGQMIELLWCGEPDTAIMSVQMKPHEGMKAEVFCDALWEAVKETL